MANEILGWVRGSEVYYPITELGDNHYSCPCKGYSYRGKCSHIDRFLKGDYSVEMKFSVTFKRGLETVAFVEGQKLLSSDDVRIDEVIDKVLSTEQFLEKLTGFRVHIEQVL